MVARNNREYPTRLGGIELKKKYGQHFLNDQLVVDHMIAKVNIANASVFEIGPGSGFLTSSILRQPVARLWAFEIDTEWADYLSKNYTDERLRIFNENFLDIDFSVFEPYAPWVVLANLPYQVTFPILYAFMNHRHLISEGVVMIQEEVAQKIVKKSGRGYGFHSLFLQHYCEWQLLDKVPPSSFTPPPKVNSRLLYFKPKQEVKPIANEVQFWKFIKICFSSPRRTLKNNLVSTHYDLAAIAPDILAMRAQELTMADLLDIWGQIS